MGILSEVMAVRTHLKCIINRIVVRRIYGAKKETLGNDYNEEIIVSLTSYPQRFNVLPDAIISIFMQTLRPDRIILYFEDDVNYNELPPILMELCQYGLEIEMRPHKIRPHKKYYYAMTENTESIIITIDDDMLYSRELIRYLLNEHISHPGSVIAARAHRIKCDDNAQVLPYLKWEWESNFCHVPSDDLFATGVGGVLYPPRCLDNKAFNIDNILKMCLNADDIWLKVMESMVGTKVCLVDRKVWKKTYCLNKVDEGLNAINCGQNGNDAYIKNMIDEYQCKCFCDN